MRDSFVMYESYIDALRALPPEHFKIAMLAIADYALYGKMPDEPFLLAMVGMVKYQVDKNNAKYDASVENGKKGGRPKTQQNLTEPNKTQQNLNKPSETQQNLTEPDETIYVYDSESVTENKLCSFTEVNESTRQRVIDAWNALQPQGITPIKVIAAESKRGHMLKARIQQYGVDGVINAINSVNEQAFLHGQEWFTFDWFIKPNNFVKVFEGNYKGRAKPEVKNKFVNMDARTDNADKYAQLEQAQAKPVEDWAALERTLLGG